MPAHLHRPASRPTFAVAVAILCACGAQEEAAPEVAAAAPGALEAQLRLGRPQSVIVALETEAGDAAAAAAGPSGARDALGARVAASSRAYEAAKANLLAALPTDGVAVLHRYAALPALHLEVRSEAALAALRAGPGVSGVYEDVASEATLAESLPLVGQPLAAAAGATGAGTAVAILDTGLDYTRAAFGACSAPGPGCRVKFTHDFASGDGALDAMGHGTNVAGIVAGVAPGADLLGLDVFNGRYAYTSDVLAAMSWCVQHRAAYNIVALNLSLGSGGATGPCTDGFSAGIHAARAAGIVVVAASGNNAYPNRIASPACSAEAVSVGAVYDAPLGGLAFSMCADGATAADQITCFSNSSRYLTLLAPGALVTAAGITMVGTSQAAPHVAGAVAVVRAANPGLGADQAVAQLRAAGKPVTDPRNGVVTPRLDLSGVSQACNPALTGGGAVAGEGGSATAALSLGPACRWTATAGAAWLRVAPASGTGSAGLTLTAAANPGAARSAAVTVGGRSVTVTQAARAPPRPSGEAARPHRAAGRDGDRGATGPGTLVR